MPSKNLSFMAIGSNLYALLISNFDNNVPWPDASIAVMTIRSLFYVLVLNKDFSVKLDKNGPYLVPILTKSPYFFKSLTEEKNILKTFLLIQSNHFDCKICTFGSF